MSFVELVETSDSPVEVCSGAGGSLLRRGWAVRVSADTRNCPETAMKLPAGGHEFCPLTVMGSARHDVVCLTVLRG